MKSGRVAAAALASGLALGAPCAPGAPSPTPKREVPHVRPAAASQPASAPASLPASRPALHLDELLVYRATQRGPHDLAIADAAERWGVSPWLMRGLLYHESKLQPAAVNEATGAAGVAQFTAGGRAGVSNLRRARGASPRFTLAHALDPREAIPAAAELLAYARDVCGGLWQALALYNTGSCHHLVTGFVRAVEKHMNRFRTAAGLPPVPPLVRVVKPRRPPES